MSEDELKKAGHEEEQDEVEGHVRIQANDEPAAEGDDGDDVEAHVRRTS